VVLRIPAFQSSWHFAFACSARFKPRLHSALASPSAHWAHASFCRRSHHSQKLSGLSVGAVFTAVQPLASSPVFRPLYASRNGALRSRSIPPPLRVALGFTLSPAFQSSRISLPFMRSFQGPALVR